jgi:hypothetical protein
MLSAQASNAFLERLTAAPDVFSLISLTLFLRSQNFRKSLNVATTSVTFTPNIIVNSITLNSSGVLPNFNFVLQVEVQQLVRWNNR